MPKDPPAVVAYLGLGANLGDRERQIHEGLERLGAVPGVSVCAVSSLIETEPIGGPPQGLYLNGAAQIECSLPPHALLAVLQQIERALGREAGPRNGPRPLDLDLLLFGDLQIETRDLQVPHPRLWEREFVLAPLRELGAPIPEIPPAGPRVVEAAAELQSLCRSWRSAGLRVGMVPTMGALHAGHEALVRAARAACDRVVVSIFVNPLQFGPGEDFERYPRTFAEDLDVLRACAADAVFAPAPEEVFPPDFASRIAVGAEAEGMEGATRPGHFSGVATVVARLWQWIVPHAGYFGQKDAQQVAVLRRLHRDLALSGSLVECPTVREADGLALSSRNRYLDPADRQAAPVLHRAMVAARQRYRAGETCPETLLQLARELLTAEPRADLDYIELRAEPDLAPVPDGEALRRAAGLRMLVAARFGSGEKPTRLIDNLRFVDGE